MTSIVENKWGYVKLNVQGQVFEYGKPHTNRADIILTNNYIELWNWKDEKTFCDTHSPGISKKLIYHMYKLGCNEIIISKGYHNVLETQEDVLQYVEELGMTYHHLNTQDAIIKWNELTTKNKSLGLILHSTC